MIRTALFDARPAPTVAVAGIATSASAARDVLAPGERRARHRGQSQLVSADVLPPPALRPRAMVIEPSRRARAFLSEALSSFEPGFEVVTAAGPEQAAEWLASFTPDLIVVNPADAPGAVADFVAVILARPETRHCRVLVMGGGDLGGRCRVDAVLPGDANLSELLAAVRRLSPAVAGAPGAA